MGEDGAGTLLEREESARRLADLSAAAVDGRGSLVVVVGRAGEGKSALLDAAGGIGAQVGLRVWRARGTDLERPFSLGVVRQLLAPAVVEIGPGERASMFEGAARVGLSALDLDEDHLQVPLDPFAVQHGLYWLLAALSRRQAAMLIVDDAHWADDSSLAWLASLRGRIEELSALVVVATRPSSLDGSGGALGALISDPGIPLLRVAPLGRASIAELTRDELGAEPEQAFTEACHRATDGNPLAVIELLREMRREGGQPDAARAMRLGDRAPEAIERHVRGRLDRLGSEAVAVAQALAVLGDEAELQHVAELAGVELDHGAGLVEELIIAGIAARATELRFEHPLVHAAVRDSITEPRRGLLHARAAAALADGGRDPESVAAHLLLALPAGEQRTVDSLRAAAAVALQRGSPDAAFAYLRRAVAEPPPSRMRSAVLGELGAVAWATGQTTAVEYLESARALTSDARERAHLDLMLAEMCFYGGDYDRSMAVLETALADLDGRDDSLELQLHAMRMTSLATVDSGWPAAADPQYEQLVARAGPEDELGRELQLTLAFVGAWRGRHDAAETIARIDRAFGESMVTVASAGSLMRIAQGVAALIHADQCDRAVELADGMLTHAAANGIAIKAGNAYFMKGMAELRSGSLANAEADLTAALDIAIERGAGFAEVMTRCVLAEVLTERGRLSEAAATLEGIPPETETRAVRYFRHAALARLHCAGGARAAAIAELEAIGQEAASNEFHNPRVLPWRSQLAHLLATEDPVQAVALADSELADARRLALPSAVGVALRARGACEQGSVREATLSESVAALERGPARLELTQALIDLGAHLRRSGRRRDAREPLRRALDLASRCSAEPLIMLAGDELRAADGRPRSPWLTGAAALTTSELRVARLAASGLSNRQIAEALFVTVKTVEMHLTHLYRKLGSSSRNDLPRLLETELEGDQARQPKTKTAKTQNPRPP